MEIIANYTVENTAPTVTFSHTPHDSDELVTETVPVFEFIKKMIIHIPERNFKMIRYFGFYCTHNPKHAQYLKHIKRFEPAHIMRLKSIHKSWRKLIKFTFGHDPIKCIYCGDTLELIELFCDPRKIKYYFTIYNRWDDPYLERMKHHAKT